MLESPKKKRRTEINENHTVGDIYYPEIGGVIVTKDFTGSINLLGSNPEIKVNNEPYNPFGQDLSMAGAPTFHDLFIDESIYGGNTITAPNLTASSSITVPTLNNVSTLNGINGVQVDMTGSTPPLFNVISGTDWSLGASNTTNPNKQMTLGFKSSLNRGILYAYDQGGGGGPLDVQYGFPGFTTVKHFFEGNIYIGGTIFADSSKNITCGTVNGSTIFTPSYIEVYYDSYPFNFFAAGSTITIGSTTAQASGMSVASNEITVPSVGGAKYRVTVNLPVYKESSFQLVDGNNTAITGTTFVGGSPTLDAQSNLISATFIISQPGLNKFTIRASGSGAWVGKASSGINANVTLRVVVERII